MTDDDTPTPDCWDWIDDLRANVLYWAPRAVAAFCLIAAIRACAF